MASDPIHLRAQQGAGATNPVRQQRSLQFNAFAGMDHRLPVQWEMVGNVLAQGVQTTAAGGVSFA